MIPPKLYQKIDRRWIKYRNPLEIDMNSTNIEGGFVFCVPVQLKMDVVRELQKNRDSKIYIFIVYSLSQLLTTLGYIHELSYTWFFKKNEKRKEKEHKDIIEFPQPTFHRTNERSYLVFSCSTTFYPRLLQESSDKLVTLVRFTRHDISWPTR